MKPWKLHWNLTQPLKTPKRIPGEYHWFSKGYQSKINKLPYNPYKTSPQP